MMIIINVCHECPDRKLGCHSSCKKYHDEKKAKEVKRQQYFDTKRGCKDADDYEVKRHDKIRKSMKRR